MLNSEQLEALDLVLKGHNIYIGGAAGTGKTFLIRNIVKKLKENRKIVHVTCTTGIACSAYERVIGAVTVHRWSGIEDGRYESTEICSLIKNNVKFEATYDRIKKTDCLIIDEVSMLSERLFDQILEVCRLKDPSKLTGGIQIILAGDFYQLPPVPNVMYNDQGNFCFNSTQFSSVCPHKVFLTKVIRQAEVSLISAIQEVSRGVLSEKTKLFISSLSRPLEAKDTTKLFSTNYLVDNFNREAIMQWPGELVEYSAYDSGDTKYLRQILASSKLWIKIGCPVILLRNLTDTLVNGLRGFVVDCTPEGPVVNFPAVNITTKIEKIMFSVYNPRFHKNVAVRNQVPLKLAFSLTIHKAQGMTLDSVEIDCQQIFKPGQLGVAIGRVKSASGLRIINFHPSACIPQPDSIKHFMIDPPIPPEENVECCRKLRQTQESGIELLSSFVVDAQSEYNYDPHCVDEDAFDENFNSIIASLPLPDDDPNEEDDIPQNFSIKECLTNLKSTPAVTPMQKEVNDLISMLLCAKGMENIKTFVKKQFKKLTEIIGTLNISGPVPVKPEDLTKFYEKCHSHQTGTEYRLSCMILFENCTCFTGAHSHICYNLFVAIRKFLLSEKVALYPKSQRELIKRNVDTNASKARIRYVGGYCVSKVRHRYLQIQQSNCFKSSSDDQLRFEEAKKVVKILDSLREHEHVIQATSEQLETLEDVIRKQNISKGLTHIPDVLNDFFINLCTKCLDLLIDENLNTYGENLHAFCSEKLLHSSELFRCFMSILSNRFQTETFSTYVPDSGDTLAVEQVLSKLTMEVCAINRTFEELLNKFLMVMLNQFRKDLLESFAVEKKMAHRKQIQVKKQKKEKASTTVNFDSILKDSTVGKIVSHHLLKGLVLKEQNVFESFKKQDILKLCKAYDVKCSLKDTKKTLSGKLSNAIKSADGMVKSEELTVSVDSSEAPVGTAPTEIASSLHSEDLDTEILAVEYEEPAGNNLATLASISDPVASTSEPIASTSQASATYEPSPGCVTISDVLQDDYMDSSDEDMQTEKCKICHLGGAESSWIQCDNCSYWLHRNCAGLKSVKKWKKYSRKGAIFLCKECE